MEPVRASIELRVSVAEALRRWSEHAAPLRPRQVDFEALARSRARVTLEASSPAFAAEALRRELQRDLAAFERLVDERAPAPDPGGHAQR